jgi:hypothetical protein
MGRHLIILDGNVVDNSGSPKKENGLIVLMCNIAKDLVMESLCFCVL